MSSAEKYTVRHQGHTLTRPTRRTNAHALAARLGVEYTVWNKQTRRESKP